MDDIFKTKWGPALALEQRFAAIMAEQERHGFFFDTTKGLDVRQELSGQLFVIDEILLPLLPPKRIQIEAASIEHPYRKDGKLQDRVAKWMGETLVRGPFSKVAWEPFNLNSDKQLKEFLLSVGWKPDEYNYNDDGQQTSPKLTEASLSRVEHPLGKHLARREILTHRISLVDSLLKRVREDGRIPSETNTIGAATHRCTHRVIVNIPKPKPHVFYGTQIRQLFTVPDGYAFLGVDAKGLQARCLAHYVNDSEFTAATINGDLHSDNLAALIGLVQNRDDCKNVLYALTKKQSVQNSVNSGELS